MLEIERIGFWEEIKTEVQKEEKSETPKIGLITDDSPTEWNWLAK
jgi:hypothetical protein